MRTGGYWLRRNRIAAEPMTVSASDTTTTENVEARPLDDLTKTELVELADARGVDSTGTKTELVERLSAGAE